MAKKKPSAPAPEPSADIRVAAGQSFQGDARIAMRSEGPAGLLDAAISASPGLARYVTSVGREILGNRPAGATTNPQQLLNGAAFLKPTVKVR